MSDPQPIDPRDQKTQVDAAVLTPISGAGAASPGPASPSKAPRTNAAFSDQMASGGSSGSPRVSIPIQDLLGDKLILSASRTESHGRQVPTLGGIQLLAKIGQGGMGAVYYGMHPRLMQEVAVKVLPFHLAEAQPGLIQRFIREAQIAARVRSPHLVSVIDVNEENGLFFLVMEYVPGRSAGQLLREFTEKGKTGLDEQVALAICIGAAEGLAAAHSNGVIHRDIKPDNIMLPRNTAASSLSVTPSSTTLSGTGGLDFKAAKLADLGLARNEAGDLSVTGANACMGTPGYMAPEQANDARHASRPADVFSLGATLYALLSGDSPFKGTSLMQVLNATVNQPHPPIKSIRPDVSDSTAALLDRCLAKNASERFPDAAALLRTLRESLFQFDDGALSPSQLSRLNATGRLMRPKTGPLSTDALQKAAFSEARISQAGMAPQVESTSFAPRPSRVLPIVAGVLVILFAGLGTGGYFHWQKIDRDRQEARQQEERMMADMRQRDAEDQRKKDLAQQKRDEDMRQVAYGEEERMHSSWLLKHQEKSIGAFLEDLKAARAFKAEKNYDKSISLLEDALRTLGPIPHASRSIAEKLLAEAKDEKARAQDAFAAALKSAADSKRDQNWDKAIATLEDGFNALGNAAHPSRTAAETLLKEAKDQKRIALDAFSSALKSAHAYKAKKDWDKARQTIDQALKTLGSQTSPDRTAGEALLKESKTELDNLAQSETQAMEALPAAIKLAAAYKVDRNWDKVLLALDGPLKAIGDKPHPNRESAEALVKEAKDQKERQREFKVEMDKGNDLLKGSNLIAAKAAFERAKKIAEEPAENAAVFEAFKAVQDLTRKTKLLQARVTMAEGRTQRAKGDWTKAQEAFKTAGALFLEIEERDDLARARMEEGDCLRKDNNKNGDWAQAGALYATAAGIFNSLNDKRDQAEAIVREANCKDPAYNSGGEVRLAAVLYGRAAQVMGDIGNKRGNADNLSRQATCVFKEKLMNSAERAADLFKRAALIYEELGDKKALGLSLYNEAVCSIKDKKINMTPDARALFQRAAKTSHEAG